MKARRFVILLMLINSIPLRAVEPFPYSIYPVQVPALQFSGARCAKALTPARDQFYVHRTTDDWKSGFSTQSGFYQPATGSREIRVSRSFKLRDRNAYMGYWEWRSREVPSEDFQVKEIFDGLTHYFYDRWVTDFDKNPEAVKSLSFFSTQADPLRKVHIGFRMGSELWAGLVLFDGSEDLQSFTLKGKLKQTGVRSNPRSELEYRFPQLDLRSRSIGPNGQALPLFFISTITSLHQIKGVIRYLYHRIAELALMKVSPHLVTSSIAESRLAKDPRLESQLRVQSQQILFGAAAFPTELADRKVVLPREAVNEAISNASGVKIYIASHTSLLDFYLNQGWRILQTSAEEVPIPDMRILFFDLGDFARKYHAPNNASGLGARVTEKGMSNEEYLRLKTEESERIREVLQRVRRLQSLRR